MIGPNKLKNILKKTSMKNYYIAISTSPQLYCLYYVICCRAVEVDECPEAPYTSRFSP